CVTSVLTPPSGGRRSCRAGRSNADAGPDRAVLGHDHDAVTDEVSVSVGFVEAGGVDEPRAVADARVLVDDRAIEADVPSDAERRPAVGGRLGFIEVRAQQHGAGDPGAGLDRGPNADDRLLDAAAIEVTPLGDDGIADRAVAESRAREEPRVRVDGPVR